MLGGNLVTRSLVGNRVVGGTWTLGSGATWTFPAVTLGGAVAGGDQAFTGVGDMTFTAGSLLRSGSTNTNTLLLAANDTTFITLTTGATDVCTLDGVTLKGTLLADGTVTLPAVTLGGNMTLGGYAFDAGAGSAQINTTGNAAGLNLTSTQDGPNGARLLPKHVTATPAVDDIPYDIEVWTNAIIYAYEAIRLVNVTGGSEESKKQWLLRVSGALNEAMTLSGAGALWTDLSVNTLTYKVSGTQVVGARVVDARCDDVVDNTYGAEEAGVLDALRDAMISHGLISAA